MKNDYKTIEELTSTRIKNLGTDEPSVDFTQRVMESILIENRPVYSSSPRNFLWLIGLISVIIVIGLYFLSFFQLTGLLENKLIMVTDSVQSFFRTFLTIFDQLKGISIQSTILISFIAILSLLVIEEFVYRKKHLF